MDVTLSSGPTIGREPELAGLEAALDALEGGGPTWLAVAGEPGIGKTRLLSELRARGNERGHLVLAGSAAEFERAVPFSVWVDALDAYVASQEIERDPTWDPELVRELAEMLPALRRSPVAGAPAIADERYRAHRAARRLMERFAAVKPLVFVLDDLHWADVASVELVVSLLRRGPEAPVLLALAFRPGQAPERLVAALSAPGVRRIELGHLDQAHAAELLADLDPRARDRVWRQAGGNPFYLQQLARAGTGTGTNGATVGAATGDVPPVVAAAIAEELDALAPPVRRMLEAAAVAGEPFEPDLAAAVAELSPADGLAALDDLLICDLVRPTPVPRRFVFRHPLVRQAVYASSRGGWRLAAHARAAEVLAARGAAAEERAHHVEQSATPGDDEAIAALREAGTDVAPRAPAAAVRWFEAALRLLPSGDRARQLDVREALASALRSLGELERCRTTLLETIELLPPDCGSRRMTLTGQCAAVEHWLGHHAEAHQRLAQAWEGLADRGTPEAVTLGIELVVDAMYAIDLDRASEVGRAALDTARELDDPALVVAAASALCLAEVSAGRAELARPHRELAVRQLERLTDAQLAARLDPLYHLAWAENYLELYDEAIAHADRGVALARATGEGRLLMPLMLVKCYPLEMQGHLAQVIDLCEAAVEGARLSASPHYLFWALFELAWGRYYAGQLDAAMAAGEESARVGRRMSGGTMPSAGGGPGWALAAAALESGQAERAREMMREIGGDDMAAWIPAERCFNWENVVLAELALGRPEAADRFARRSEENAAALGLRLPATMAGRARAAVELATGQPQAAVRTAQASVDAAEAIGAGLQAAFSRTLLGRALAAAGDRKPAIAALRLAEQELGACGSLRARDEVRRDLRRLGARAEPRGPSAAGDTGLAALSKREREIAALVTDRRTNREIAAELFLSDKTIESHLRNIFFKLGVSSRVDVARAVERER